jgi:hypothetical protein
MLWTTATKSTLKYYYKIDIEENSSSMFWEGELFVAINMFWDGVAKF